MCVGSDHDERVATMLRDPLIRLVMISDGVTEQAIIAVMAQLRQSLAARQRQRLRCAVAQPVDSRLHE
jgi:hypothetical protein